MHEQSQRLDQATRLRQIAMNAKAAPKSVVPHVITVTSGKGGVGKSTVALNLAIKLSDFGKHVLVVDADANLGNLDVMLGISPKLRLGDVLRGDRHFEDVIVTPRPGLAILPGSSGDASYPAPGPGDIGQIVDDLAVLEPRFDCIIVDTSAGLSPDIISFAVNSDETIVVTNPEPTAIMDAYAVIKVISLAKPEAVLQVLMNGARTPRDADEAARKLHLAINHFLKIETPYLGSIPFDPNVARAIARQHPVVEAFPMSAASLSIQNLAQRVTSRSLSMTSRRSLSWQ